MEIGKLGVWTWLDNLSAPEAAEFAGQLEEWGYGALWIPEAVGRDPFGLLAYLAAGTERLILATGIANIYARADAVRLPQATRWLSAGPECGPQGPRVAGGRVAKV